MAHYIHYVVHKLAVVPYQDKKAPWFSRNQPDNQGFLAPSYHVSRTVAGPAACVLPEDCIWLMSELQTPWGRFPPALDACVQVSSVQREVHEVQGTRGTRPQRQIRYLASPESRWFPLHDAFATLQTLESIDAKGCCQPLLPRCDLSLGIALQSMRQLLDAAPLLSLVDIIDRQGHDFISYRLADGTRAASALARRLIGEGKSIVWDRWSLPRRLAERREFILDAALDGCITQYIESSNRVWGILSPTYDVPGCYTRRESDFAKKLGKFVGVSPVGLS